MNCLLPPLSRRRIGSTPSLLLVVQLALFVAAVAVQLLGLRKIAALQSNDIQIFVGVLLISVPTLLLVNCGLLLGLYIPKAQAAPDSRS